MITIKKENKLTEVKIPLGSRCRQIISVLYYFILNNFIYFNNKSFTLFVIFNFNIIYLPIHLAFEKESYPHIPIIMGLEIFFSILLFIFAITNFQR